GRGPGGRSDADLRRVLLAVLRRLVTERARNDLDSPAILRREARQLHGQLRPAFDPAALVSVDDATVDPGALGGNNLGARLDRFLEDRRERVAGFHRLGRKDTRGAHDNATA